MTSVRIDGEYSTDDLVTIVDAAARLQIPKHEVFALIRRGELNGGFDDFVLGYRVTGTSLAAYEAELAARPPAPPPTVDVVIEADTSRFDAAIQAMTQLGVALGVDEPERREWRKLAVLIGAQVFVVMVALVIVWWLW